MGKKNRIVKKIVGILSVSFVLWSSLFLVDYDRSGTLREPLFALQTGTESGKIIFRGLGYRVEVEKDSAGKILSVTMIMFGKVISASIT